MTEERQEEYNERVLALVVDEEKLRNKYHYFYFDIQLHQIFLDCQ